MKQNVKKKMLVNGKMLPVPQKLVRITVKVVLPKLIVPVQQLVVNGMILILNSVKRNLLQLLPMLS